jgi:Colicin immunity protein / pyocin immunity protein
MLGSLDIPEIIRLLKDFERLHSSRQDYRPVLTVLERETRFPELETFLCREMFHNLRGDDFLAERLARYEPVKASLSRIEMIELVRRISTADGSEAEIDEMVGVFVANCRHPAGTDLIFWPNGCPHDSSKPEPTVEEIVDRAMSGEG